jgi:hypothetical protein
MVRWKASESKERVEAIKRNVFTKKKLSQDNPQWCQCQIICMETCVSHHIAQRLCRITLPNANFVPNILETESLTVTLDAATGA